MKLSEFKKLINEIGERIHRNNGEVWTCHELKHCDGISKSYYKFLKSIFPNFSNGSLERLLFSRGGFNNLRIEEKKALYQLRLIIVATFAAWAIETKEYLKWN